jgi:dTDP-4-amino-4,6-dideoxygalactose transaminase
MDSSNRKIDFHRPDFSQHELDEIKSSIESEWVAGPGPQSRRFEQRIEEKWDCPRALTTTSCTHALETALLSLELSETDEVIVPSFTFVSTAQAVLRAGGDIRFADVDETTLTVTSDTMKPVLSDNTVGVIFVHYGGFPGPIEPVRSLCKEHDLFLIEDAALAFDTTLNNQYAGTFGDFGTFSFHGSKNLTCGEGGLLTINQESSIKDCEMIRDKGTNRSANSADDSGRYTWQSTGSSYVLSDVLGAMLNAQFDRWETIRNQRVEVHNHLVNCLIEVDVNDSLLILKSGANRTHNGHMTAFRVKDEERAEPFFDALRSEAIEVKIIMNRFMILRTYEKR